MDIYTIENKYGSLIIDSGKKQVLGLQAFAEYYRLKTECQYVTAERLFHEYSDKSGMYEPQSNEVMIDKVSRAILDFARLKGIDDELIGMRRPAVIKDILTHLKVFAHTDKSFFDKKGNWVHCLNGIVEFENGSWVLKPFSPHYHSRNRCNLVYDPQADCPRFKRDLSEAELNQICNRQDTLQIANGVDCIGDLSGEQIHSTMFGSNIL